MLNICLKGGNVPELRLDWYLRLCEILFAGPGALLDSLLDEGLVVRDESYYVRREKSRQGAERRAQINDLMIATYRHCESLFVVLVREIRDEAAAEKIRAMLWELMTMLPDITQRSKRGELLQCDWTKAVEFFVQIEHEVWRARESIVPLARERVARLLEHAKTAMIRLDEYKKEDELIDEEREAQNDYFDHIRERQKTDRFIGKFWD